jgi:hypothetical protein
MGPVPAEKLTELLNTQTVDEETVVWRKGQADWLPLRSTEISAALKDTPVAPTHLNNGLVWAAAIAPIPFAIFDAILVGAVSQMDDDYAWLAILGWAIPAAINATLCLLDERQLKKAGYGTGWLTLFAFLLAPVYLFVRAQRVKQKPTYGFAWIACFGLSLLLRAL